MACQKCASNKSTSCSCQGTSYTIPSNAVYGDSTCRLPAEPCESVTCTECVRHCHEEDKWCIKAAFVDPADDGVTPSAIGVDLCMHRGERLDQFLQKLALAHADPINYKYKVKSFYADHITGGDSPTIKFIWFDFDSSVTTIKLQFAPDGSNDWQTINAFANIDPLITNTFTLDSTMIALLPGTTYKFRLSIATDDAVYDMGSVILYITIPVI